MKSRISFLITFCLVFIISISATTSAREITVNDDSGADFGSIQEAVDGAEAGDVIIIKPGTYIENINVSKARLTLKPEANDVFIEPVDSSEATIILSNVGTTLSGLNITGSIHVNNALLGGSEYYKNNNMSRITNNVIENGGIIVGSESSGNIISGNRISGAGIDVSCCGDFNEITNNEILNCPTGIYVYDERDVPPISDNNISNCDVGIHVSGLSYDLVNNEITNCGIGVMAGETGGATLIGNKITYCTDCGVKSTGGSFGTNYNNYFNNTVNIKFEDYEDTYAWNITLTEGTNIIGGSYIGGNYWAKPDGTGFSQTAIDANGDGIADSAYAISDINIDYLPLTAKYNSVLPTSDFTTNVTSGTIPLVVLFTDASKGGVITSWNWNFGDGTKSSEQNPTHTYSVAGNFTVNLTVSNSNGTASKTQQITVKNPKDLPVANFSTNVTSGYVPLTVQFTDLSENSIGRSWDFNNDWQGDSNDAAPIYVFTEPGSYNVNLVAINGNGTATKTNIITVLEKSSSGGSSGGSSHSSSGGSGGGAGSPEPAKNVKVKELCQVFVSSGKNVKFDFTKNVTAIVNINFDAKKTVGKTTTIVEMLKNKSTLTPEIPEGEVYNYLNIWVGNGGYGSDEDNLENAVINFRVEKSWVKDKGIDQSSIILYRYSEKKWNKLTTSLTGENDKYFYFKADTPGFSPFAITGESKEKEAATETQSKTEGKEDNTGSTAANTEQQPENKESTTSPEKTSSAPGFEIVCDIICLLGVFFYKR